MMGARLFSETIAAKCAEYPPYRAILEMHKRDQLDGHYIGWPIEYAIYQLEVMHWLAYAYKEPTP